MIKLAFKKMTKLLQNITQLVKKYYQIGIYKMIKLVQNMNKLVQNMTKLVKNLYYQICITKFVFIK